MSLYVHKLQQIHFDREGLQFFRFFSLRCSIIVVAALKIVACPALVKHRIQQLQLCGHVVRSLVSVCWRVIQNFYVHSDTICLARILTKNLLTPVIVGISTYGFSLSTV